MKTLKNKLARHRFFKYYSTGKKLLTDATFLDGVQKTFLEEGKEPSRTSIINFLLSKSKEETSYLEIGVRNPNHNFNHIKADEKFSVDPGIEFEGNPVDFKVTSDQFFESLCAGEILSTDIKFDVIFIDGLHLAEQVDRDILNAMKFIKDDGFIVLHDCNPPTEWHAREEYYFPFTPARHCWNGTTWKAFFKWRINADIGSCCIDSDWGVGILSKNKALGESIEKVNPFFEFSQLEKDRKNHLNLISFEEFQAIMA